MQTLEIVLYLLVSFSLSVCLILTTVICFVYAQFRAQIADLKKSIEEFEISLLDQKIELNLKYEEQLATLAKSHNEHAAQLADLSGKVTSLNSTVQGVKLNGKNTSQNTTIPPVFPGRF